MRRYSCFIRDFAIIISVLLLTSCRAGKSINRETYVRDSVVYKEIVREVEIEVKVPYEVVKNVTLDTFSRIETSVALSEVYVSRGVLIHSLCNKQVGLKDVITVRDTVREQYKDTGSNRVETIVKYRMSKFQYFIFCVGVMGILLIIYRMLLFVFRGRL